MKKLVSLFLAFICILPFSVYASAEKKALPSGLSYGDIEQTMTDYYKANDKAVGLSLCVFDENGSVYQKSFGFSDKENQIPVDENTVFEWGSISKTLIYVSLFQLWEKGKIDFDKDIREYLPSDFFTKLKYDDPITLRHLMNHEAGFEEVVLDLFKKEYTPENLETSLKSMEPKQVFRPGEVTAYSNWGSCLSALVVEKVSGMKYSDYVHKYIFKPLGMNKTAILPDYSDNPWVKEQRSSTQSYTSQGKLLKNIPTVIMLYPVGMATSTIGDLATYAQALLPMEKNEGLLFDKFSTYEALYTPSKFYGQSDIPLFYHGFINWVYGVDIVGHNGNTAGQTATMTLSMEEKTGLIVMTNQDAEFYFNFGLLDKVFGKAEENASWAKRVSPPGLYQISRSVFSGPLSFMRLQIMPLSVGPFKDFFFVPKDDTGSIITTPFAMDVKKLSTGELISVLAILLMMLTVLLHSSIWLIIRLVRRIRGKKVSGLLYKEAGRLNLASALYIYLLVWMIKSSLSFPTTAEFKLFSVLAFLFLLLLVAQIIKTVMARRKAKEKIAFCYVSTILSSVFSLILIIYFQSYQFWNL